MKLGDQAGATVSEHEHGPGRYGIVTIEEFIPRPNTGHADRHGQEKVQKGSNR